MGELKALLEASSLDADQVLARLKSLLGGTPFQDLIEPLEEKLNDFDYEQALVKLSHLKKRLGLKDQA
ncbi:MAG: hypothetical protein QG552_2062 [Thermodesulfobacteriota bacterium]|nr:hypothetical protein [Thermodesulfobacteriota bacterium]